MLNLYPKQVAPNLKHIKECCKYVPVFGFVLLFLCSCDHQNNQIQSAAIGFASAVRSAITNELTGETIDAGNILLEMHEQGHLPGASPNDHGEVTSELVDYSNTNELTYPISRTFHVFITGGSATNNYMLQKQSKDSIWQLKKAWKTDFEGKIIEEWPVK
jgi:hypothetical protein